MAGYVTGAGPYARCLMQCLSVGVCGTSSDMGRCICVVMCAVTAVLVGHTCVHTDTSRLSVDAAAVQGAHVVCAAALSAHWL